MEQRPEHRWRKLYVLVLKNKYLTTALDHFKYMKIPLALFPNWVKKQYNLDVHAQDRVVFLEIRQVVWGLPQAGILANKLLQKRLASHGYYECASTPGLYGSIPHTLLPSPSWWMILV
jgi:hypothetical protein